MTEVIRNGLVLNRPHSDKMTIFFGKIKILNLDRNKIYFLNKKSLCNDTHY